MLPDNVDEIIISNLIINGKSNVIQIRGRREDVKIEILNRDADVSLMLEKCP